MTAQAYGQARFLGSAKRIGGRQTVCAREFFVLLPKLKLCGSEVRPLHTDAGMPVGLLACEFTEHTVKFCHDFRLLFYTDRISEALNRQDQEFGSETAHGIRRYAQLQPHPAAGSR